MTREEKVDMFAMRLDGFTMEQIGEKYGISKERVRQILEKSIRERQYKATKQYVYPAIAAWMKENHITQKDISHATGMAPATISSILRGRTNPSFYFCKYICEETGLSLQEAFAP